MLSHCGSLDSCHAALFLGLVATELGDCVTDCDGGLALGGCGMTDPGCSGGFMEAFYGC